MKKISKISGLKKLDRNKLRQITGGSCTQEGRFCCLQTSTGQVFCAPGVCQSHTCIFF